MRALGGRGEKKRERKVNTSPWQSLLFRSEEEAGTHKKMDITMKETAPKKNMRMMVVDHRPSPPTVVRKKRRGKVRRVSCAKSSEGTTRKGQYDRVELTTSLRKKNPPNHQLSARRRRERALFLKEGKKRKSDSRLRTRFLRRRKERRVGIGGSSRHLFEPGIGVKR